MMRARSITYLFKSTWLWSIILVSLALYGGWRAANHYIPHQHLPWQPLSLSADIGWATRTQILALSLAPRSQCLALLEREGEGANFTILPEQKNDEGCGWSVAVSATRSRNIAFVPAELTTLCPMAAASQIWLRELDLLAQDVFGSGLSRIHHYGSYSCRNISGTSRRSEHAFANAWDVSAFDLEDGRRISVLKDWDGEGASKRFLRGARDKACQLFRVTLSPDYNTAHADHFHLDMGPSSSCH